MTLEEWWLRKDEVEAEVVQVPVIPAQVIPAQAIPAQAIRATAVMFIQGQYWQEITAATVDGRAQVIVDLDLVRFLKITFSNKYKIKNQKWFRYLSIVKQHSWKI